jgi:probable HAF family extracellular repeat protein
MFVAALSALALASPAPLDVQQPEYELTLLSTANPGQSMGIGAAVGTLVGACRPLPGVMEPCIWVGGVRTELGLPPASTQGNAQAANSSGVVVGYGDAGAFGTGTAFRYENGQMSVLPAAVGSVAWAIDVNEAGVVAGATSVVAGGAADVAVLWDAAGQPQALGTLGGQRSLALGLNELGHVVGWSNRPNGDRRAFLFAGGQLSELPLLRGHTRGTASDINDRGLIVGGSGLRAVRWERGQAFPLPVPDWAKVSYAEGVNEAGHIVGVLNSSIGGPAVPALWRSGRPVPLKELATAPAGWVFVHVSDVDDSGRIVGSGSLGGQGRAFVLTPIVN